MRIVINCYIQPKTQQKQQPQFTGYKSVFSKKLDEVLLSGRQPDLNEKNFLIEKLQKFIREKLRPNRKIGNGFHGSVYKIDDKYVLKVAKHDKPYADFIDKITPRRFSALKTYYGEPVATFYDAQILRNVSSNGKHIQAGIPQKYSLMFSPDYCQKYYEEFYLPVFSKVPQKSFDAIAKDCNTLNKMGNDDISYSFDYLNPNNFVLVGKTIRITDVINKETCENPNTMAQLLYVFLQKTDLDNAAHYNKYLEPYRRILMEKIILAGMKHNLPVENSPYHKKVWQVVSNGLCKSKEQYTKLIENLKKLQEIPDTKLRLSRTKEYLENIYSVENISTSY